MNLIGAEASQYEANIEKLYRVSRIAGKSGVCIDLGAHVGIFALKVAMISDCVVHAYEPDSVNFDCLKQNVAANGCGGRIVMFNEAVWDERGKAELYMDPDANSTDSNTLFNMHGWKTSQISTVKVDDVLERAAGPIRYLKVNCEGGEYFVLRYLSKCQVRLNDIEMMCVELHPSMLGDEKCSECVSIINQIRRRMEMFGSPRMKVMVAPQFRGGMSNRELNELCFDAL